MKTPIYEEHRRLGAKMTQFAGWEMPLYYSGIVREVQIVRSSAGIFDLSHMGEFMISGPGALSTLQFVTTNDVSALDVGQAQYTLMCDENGGVIDDLIVYRVGPDQYMPVVNASNRETDLQWIESHKQSDTVVHDRSMETGLIAVQGPNSISILQPLADFDLDGLRRFHVRRGWISEIGCWIARTGYTGENGFELYCSAGDTPRLWELVMKSGEGVGAEPVGLGARDILRMEAGYPLYGQELTRETTPVESRLMWTVKPAKGNFIGREAIMRAQEQGLKQLLVGLEAVERCVPRHGYEITSGGVPVGQVTSGTFSPTLEKGIAMAYVKPEYAAPGVMLDIQIRNKPCAARVVGLPFYHIGGMAATAAARTARGV